MHLLISQINFLILFLYHTQHCSGITPGKSAAHAKGFGKEGGNVSLTLGSRLSLDQILGSFDTITGEMRV